MITRFLNIKPQTCESQHPLHKQNHGSPNKRVPENVYKEYQRHYYHIIPQDLNTFTQKFNGL